MMGADGELVAKYVCRAQDAVPLRMQNKKRPAAIGKALIHNG